MIKKTDEKSKLEKLKNNDKGEACTTKALSMFQQVLKFMYVIQKIIIVNRTNIFVADLDFCFDVIVDEVNKMLHGFPHLPREKQIKLANEQKVLHSEC